MVTFTTRSSPDPAASRTRARLRNTCSACASKSPRPTICPSWSMAAWPETITSSPTRKPCESRNGSYGSGSRWICSTSVMRPPASGRDHLLLDADTRRERALDLERHGGRVLQGDPCGVEHRDLVVALPALELAADHLADLACDVLLRDEALAQRDVDLAVRDALADVVDEQPAALQDRRVQLLLALEIGAERREVRARRDPCIVDDPAACVRTADDDVRAAAGGLEIRRARDAQVRIPRLLLAEKTVDRFLRPAPDAHLGPRKDRVARGQRPLGHAPCAGNREDGGIGAREPPGRDGGGRAGPHQRVV